MEIIDEKFIKRRVSEEQLFTYYFGRWELNGMYRNPLRADNRPTCNFFYHRTKGTLFLKDPAWGQQYPSKGCFSVFIYVQFKYNLKTNYDACYKIAVDFNLVDDKGKPLAQGLPIEAVTAKPIIHQQNFSSIKIKPKIITDIGLDFWSRPDYRMKAATLQKLNTYMASDAWINGKLSYWNQPFMFAYHLEGDSVFQLYFPDKHEREYRFRCNQVSKLYCTQFVRPTEKYVIVTKSYKDFIFLHISGFNVCCILSENYKLTPEELAFLKQNGKRVFLFYDYDKTGMQFARMRAEEYECDYIFTQDVMNKDYSDMSDAIGLRPSRQIILDQLREHGVDI